MDARVGLVKEVVGSVVNVHAEVASGHPSTAILGDERMGSGVVIDASGLILTVNYMVMGAKRLEVTLGRGRALRAEIAAQDFDVGLALLRVRRQGLPAVRIGPSAALARGMPVFALASTGPRERRVAGGVVTYLGEFDAYWEYLLDRAVVTSAPNPGVGGGGLFTLAGSLVGVVSLNLGEVGRTSLAIPTECFEDNRQEFLRYGRVVSRPQRAWLGLFAEAVEEGVVVAGLVPDGPGARSGVREGDVIVSLDSREVGSRRELYRGLWQHGPGERIALEVLRDNELRLVHVTSGDRADFYKQIS